VSGIIFCGGLYHQAAADHEHYHRLHERGLPAVLVNAAIDDLGFPRVCVDDGHAVDQAFNHLTSLGHKRIGLLLGPADHAPSNRKLAAFQAAAAEVSTVDDSDVERVIFSMEGGRAGATRLIKHGV